MLTRHIGLLLTGQQIILRTKTSKLVKDRSHIYQKDFIIFLKKKKKKKKKKRRKEQRMTIGTFEKQTSMTQ
jgi:hypothetical protein